MEITFNHDNNCKSAYGQRIKVFDAQIPHSIRAVEATAEGKSIFAYDKGGKVAAAYEQFAKEVAEIAAASALIVSIPKLGIQSTRTTS